MSSITLTGSTSPKGMNNGNDPGKIIFDQGPPKQTYKDQQDLADGYCSVPDPGWSPRADHSPNQSMNTVGAAPTGARLIK